MILSIRMEGTIVEQGQISFFYRPKVERDEASSLTNIQRFYFLLSPTSNNAKARLAIIGKKKLPLKNERFFGFIDAVGDAKEIVSSSLGEKAYETKTRGTRHLAAARVLAEGLYSIKEHHGHTHLVYKLEQPEQPERVQEDFNVDSQGCFVIQVKNPQRAPVGGGKDPGLEDKAEYSEEEQQEFSNYAWIGVHESHLLDHERAEFLLVGVGKEEERLGEEAEGAPRGGVVEELKREGVVETGPEETGKWE